MRHLIIALMTAMMLFASTGIADARQICGVVYRSYGLLNEDNNHDPNVYYDVNWLGVAAGVLFAGTVIVPVYVVGFSLMRPVGMRQPIGCAKLRVVR